ncbi:MAG: lysine--tRNA ligase, partial [Ilumatobacteraceae bacterium]
MNEPNTPESGSEGDDSSELTGSGLAAEKTRRLTRVDQLRDAGVNPYPYRFDRSHTLAEVRAQWGSLEPGTETETAVA